MAQFQAFAPDVEVSGAGVQGLIQAMGLFQKMGLSILAKHGIKNPTPESWHSQQAYLDAYREMYEQIGAKTVKQIGRKIPDTALWPPSIRTIVEALSSIDVAYHMNHRGGEIGYYRFESTGPRAGKMICQTPYPCPFDEGIIEATAQKFASPEDRVRVTHIDPQICRIKGADTCTYQIVW